MGWGGGQTGVCKQLSNKPHSNIPDSVVFYKVYRSSYSEITELIRMPQTKVDVLLSTVCLCVCLYKQLLS